MQNALTAIMGALSIASWIRMRKINVAFNNTKIKQTDSFMVILLIGSLFIVMYSQVIILILMLFVYRKDHSSGKCRGQLDPATVNSVAR